MVCRKQDSQNMRPCEISSAGSPKSRGVGWASEPKGQRFCGHGGSPLGRLRLRLGLASLGCVGSLKSPKKSMLSIQQRYSLTRQRSELGHKSGHTKVLILCELQDRAHRRRACDCDSMGTLPLYRKPHRISAVEPSKMGRHPPTVCGLSLS